MESAKRTNLQQEGALGGKGKRIDLVTATAAVARTHLHSTINPAHLNFISIKISNLDTFAKLICHPRVGVSICSIKPQGLINAISPFPKE